MSLFVNLNAFLTLWLKCFYLSKLFFFVESLSKFPYNITETKMELKKKYKNMLLS